MTRIPGLLLSIAALMGAVALTHGNEQSPNGETAAPKIDPRNVAPEKLAQLFDVPQEFLNELGKSNAEKLNRDEFESYLNQFGHRDDGQPMFQVSRDNYFVLLTIGDLMAKVAGGGSMPVVGGVGPGAIDLRNLQTPVRNQGRRGTCVAFAACAELEAILKKQTEKDYELCENLAYLRFMQESKKVPCDDLTVVTVKAADYLKKHVVCEAKHWPYVGTSAIELKASGMCGLIDSAPAAVNGTTGWGVDQALILPSTGKTSAIGAANIKDTRTLESILGGGNGIVFGTFLAWRNKDAEGVIDVKLSPTGQPLPSEGGHALLLVGYDKRGPIPYFIAKNSYGKQYGHAGYLYLSYNYIRTYAKYGYVTTKIRTDTVNLP